MASLINKLLGRDDEEHSHKSDSKCESGKCETSKSETMACSTTNAKGEKCGDKQGTCGHTTDVRTVQHDGVNIKSTISTEGSSSVSLSNQQKLTDLVSKLGSTHSQIDQYARNQTEKINDEIQREIDEVVARTRREQETLLQKANEHTGKIDQEYRARLQVMVEEIDSTKAKRIAEIETELNNQQNGILQAARNEIDQLNQKAAKLKIGVLESAQAKATMDAKAITAQAANLGQTSAVHSATGTTTIKTEVSAAATTKEVGGTSTHTSAASGAATSKDAHSTTSGAKHTSETKTVETTAHQSKN